MDQPAAKKRRLAPKVEPQASPTHLPPPIAHEPLQPVQHYQAQEAPPPPERHEFESFARHLQDAAMLIYRQSQRSPYNNVSVLLLRWEEDNAVEPDLAALELVLRERYNYRTDRWNIPPVANPSIKLGVRLATFLEPAGPDHLLIVYYAGYGYVGVDNQLFWACNAREDAPRLKWSGFRCLFEESPSDMLLLLDTCAAREQPGLGGSSVKQVIATSTPEQYSRDPGARSFTANITEAFVKLSTGRPFSAEHLYQEAALLRQYELLQNSGLTNGASKGISITDKLPVLYTMSSGGKSQGLGLSPMSPNTAPQLLPPHPVGNGDPRTSGEDHSIHPSAVADLTFDEPRVLVCTTFVGEASPDMSSFNHWLHNAPATASKIAVEGMFLGPPTMLLISMPVPVWNVVQNDKVCCFLGYVNSHNMTHLYKRLVGSMSVAKASAKDMEDGRMLLEAREVAASTPIIHRHDVLHRDPNHAQLPPETPPMRPDSMGRPDPASLPQSTVAAGLTYSITTPVAAVTRKEDVEESAEMQEAAEQLKALSHVRHLSDDVPSSAHVQPSARNDSVVDIKPEERSSHEANESGADEAHYNGDAMTPSGGPKQPRRSLQKQAPKQETRCGHCSHAPFKDSSSLRKHIAAAHTRPFPCAFAFAGCTSTFGSKNEWKRHIASQHLCLTYYRCSSCPQTTVEGKGNEFNRKDLFTQHLRRMHAPFAIKKAIAKGDSKLQVEWESHVKELQQSCLVTRRKPPQRSACPKPDCASVFEGPTSWDEWTEHVGRHMEKGEAARLGVDRLLAKWALEEAIIERKEDGEYRLCSGAGSGPEKEANSNAEYHSDGNKRERDPDERTIIAASTMVDRMEVDG
ncbi:Uu.00g099240.m01.CDS01 [Anthostomella pinea]|uniref:Uu.00g099240.m01.CDS01 n=1 Tax=Anthostomella pinea TaxID=933095 RepID=A0AAI8YF71_9PEZI|nr:Uu.00g099240.m01.CDS01 [Anthostomella pinea]